MVLTLARDEAFCIAEWLVMSSSKCLKYKALFGRLFQGVEGFTMQILG